MPIMEYVACNLCGKRDEEFLLEARDDVYKSSEEKFRIVRCRQCSLVYLNPRPEARELSRFYPDSYKPFKNNFTGFKYNPPQNPKQKIIDVGCGSGNFLEKLHRADPTLALEGLDFDPRACAVARAKGFLVFEGTLFEAKYPDSHFDGVYMSHYLEHVPDPVATLVEVLRILKPGGRVMVRLPNFNSISRMFFGGHWAPLEPPRHFYHFTPKTLEAVARKAGFEKVLVSFVHSSPKYFVQSLALMFFSQKQFRPYKAGSLLMKILAPLGWIVRGFSVAGQMQLEAIK